MSHIFDSAIHQNENPLLARFLRDHKLMHDEDANEPEFTISKINQNDEILNDDTVETENDLVMHEDGRLSLAYERLTHLPTGIIQKYCSFIRVLDLSHNDIRDLSFLSLFNELHTLILDKNPYPDHSTLPALNKLEIFWLNNCGVLNVFKWIYKIQKKCPNIRQLSLMGNPGAMSYLNGATAAEHIDYRMFVLSVISSLEYLDDTPFTWEQKRLVEINQTACPSSDGGPMNFINMFGSNNFCNLFRYSRQNNKKLSRESCGSDS